MFISRKQGSQKNENQRAVCFVTEGVWKVIKPEGQPRLRKIKGLVTPWSSLVTELQTDFPILSNVYLDQMYAFQMHCQPFLTGQLELGVGGKHP